MLQLLRESRYENRRVVASYGIAGVFARPDIKDTNLMSVNKMELVEDNTSLSEAIAAIQPRNASIVRLILYSVQAFIDVLALGGGFGLALAVTNSGIVVRDVPALGAVVPVYLVMAMYRNAYSFEALNRLHLSWSRTLNAVAISLGLLLAVSVGFKLDNDYFGPFLVQGFAISLPLIMAGRAALCWFVKYALSDRFISLVLIRDDVDTEVPEGFTALDAQALGLKPDINSPAMLHRMAQLLSNADFVLVSCPPERRKPWSVVLRGLGVDGELVIPELTGIGLENNSFASNLPLLRVSFGPLSMRNRIVKRLFDVALSVVLLVVLSPLMLLVALAIKLDSKGPVLFEQQRVGRGNRFFNIFKFRSMRVESSDAAGNVSTLRDDDRITRVGRIIRATSIDELPQLLNVVLGDMSLVGPRPHALGSRAENRLFWEIDQRYFTRHAVKPGITGIAQVRGFRGGNGKASRSYRPAAVGS